MSCVYEKVFSVTDNMCGQNTYMKPSGVLDVLQSIAGEHANLLGIGFDDVIKKNLCYIIARNKYDMLKPIKRFTNIRVKTWPATPAKIDLDRYYEIYDADTNELLLTGVSKWLLIDITTRRIARTSNVEFPNDIYEKVLYESFDKLRFDGISFEESYDFVVRFSDLDLNNHMNNTKYAEALVYDQEKVVNHFEINYISEVVRGDILNIYYQKDNNEAKFQGITNDKVSFTAYYTYFN